MWYSILADIVVAVHVAYVSFVIFGQLAILLGMLLRWQWIRNPWFRWAHLVMILIVAFEAMMSITCPLTTWEFNLRTLAGEQAAQGSFMGRLLHDLMFCNAPQYVFTTSYITFALMVLGTFCLAPPRSFFRRRAAAAAATPAGRLDSRPPVAL